MAPAEFCREVEAYLCRKNDGHLIRIAGPAFEQVCGWAEQGVPLAVAFRGIDRTFERYYRKGERRRPVRIEFCEADVLDAFDGWRRAVGVALIVGGTTHAGGDPATQGPRRSLPAHLDRAAARLSSLAAGAGPAKHPEPLSPALAAAIDRTLAEIEAMRPRARTLRGEARVSALDRLRALDAELIASAREASNPDLLAAVRREAEQELAPFAARMPAEAHARALETCRDRLVRDRLGLPSLAFD